MKQKRRRSIILTTITLIVCLGIPVLAKEAIGWTILSDSNQHLGNDTVNYESISK